MGRREEIGNRLGQVLSRRKNIEIARLIEDEVGVSAISRWRSGDRLPGLERFSQLCEVLELTPAEILSILGIEVPPSGMVTSEGSESGLRGAIELETAPLEARMLAEVDRRLERLDERISRLETGAPRPTSYVHESPAQSDLPGVRARAIEGYFQLAIDSLEKRLVERIDGRLGAVTRALSDVESRLGKGGAGREGGSGGSLTGS